MREGGRLLAATNDVFRGLRLLPLEREGWRRRGWSGRAILPALGVAVTTTGQSKHAGEMHNEQGSNLLLGDLVVILATTEEPLQQIQLLHSMRAELQWLDHRIVGMC